MVLKMPIMTPYWDRAHLQVGIKSYQVNPLETIAEVHSISSVIQSASQHKFPSGTTRVTSKTGEMFAACKFFEVFQGTKFTQRISFLAIF